MSNHNATASRPIDGGGMLCARPVTSLPTEHIETGFLQNARRTDVILMSIRRRPVRPANNGAGKRHKRRRSNAISLDDPH
jgi:hypothetical protein